MTIMRRSIIACVGVLLAVQAAAAQSVTVDPYDAVIDKLIQMAQLATGPDAEKRASEVVGKAGAVARRSPSSKQIGAPASSGPGTVVNRADFGELFGLALDNNFVSLDEGATTFDLNLFGIRSLLNPAVVDRQTLYESSANRWLRRFGGAMTFGSAGEAFDQDGDGTVDEARRPTSPTDSIAWELRVRLVGGRDRRDRQALARYQRMVLRTHDSAAKAVGDLLASYASDFPPVVTAEFMEKFLQRADVEGRLAMLVEDTRHALDADSSAVQMLDKRAVVTAVATGTARRREFGPNKIALGLRGVVGAGRVDHSLNLDWLQVNGLREFPDAETWKAGYSLSVKALQGTRLANDGVDLSLSASAERFRNVPGATHNNVVKVIGKAEFPIREGVTVPLSVMYANHRDLLDDQDAIVGHIGVAFDLSALKKPAK